MRLICLNGKDYESDKNTINTNIKDTELVFVYTGDKLLYQYIDELKLDDQQLYRLKICKEKLDLDVTLIDCEQQEKKISKLSYLIEEIELQQKYTVVVNDNDRTKLAHIIQQLVYLSISLEDVQVLTLQELRDNKKLHRFMSKLNELEDKVVLSKLQIGGVETQPEMLDTKQKIVTGLENIKTYVDKSKELELKIAVAASKKTGKSVVVNSMIGEELAPTSLELATPNNCIYKKSPDNKYRLTYSGNSTKEFETADEMKSFITAQFKAAQDDEANAFTIEDMDIYYKTDKNNFEAYTIYDTPGPDLAGATGHKEAAKRAMEAADVVIFCIDYSKYLTDGEEKYLNEVKEMFNKNGKFYSLIFAVNKLDCRYTSEGDKSVVRILDFIRSKLIKLDKKYEDCVIMGTSALTYFYAHTATQIEGCDCLLNPTEAGYDNLADALEACIDNYTARPEMTTLNFLDEQRRRCRNFHGIKINSIEEIKQMSGMLSLLSYVRYIAKGKAIAEAIQYNSNHIDQEYAQIKNIFNMNELQEKIGQNEEKIEEIKSILRRLDTTVQEIFLPEIRKEEIQKSSVDLLNTYEAVISAKGKTFTINSIKEEIQEDINEELKEREVRKSLDKEIETNFLVSILRLRKDIDENNYTEEETIQKVKACFEEFGGTINNQITEALNNLIQEGRASRRKDANAVREEIASVLNIRMERLREEVERCKEDLQKNCDLEFNLELPSFEFGFLEEECVNKAIDEIQIESIQSTVKQLIEVKSKVDTSSLWKTFKYIFGHPTMQHYEVLKYDIDTLIEQFDEVYEPIKKEIHYKIDELDIEQIYKPDVDAIYEEMEEFFEQIINQVEEYNHNGIAYTQGINDILDDSEDYATRNERLMLYKAYLEDIYVYLAEFFKLWNDIRRA